MYLLDVFMRDKKAHRRAGVRCEDDAICTDDADGGGSLEDHLFQIVHLSQPLNYLG
jgi:hypothetical protein